MIINYINESDCQKHEWGRRHNFYFGWEACDHCNAIKDKKKWNEDFEKKKKMVSFEEASKYVEARITNVSEDK